MSLALRQTHTSSPHAEPCCGPRSLSGSSLENMVAVTPLGHVNLLLVGSYNGLLLFGAILSNPLGPSTITSRQSLAVAAIKAIWLTRALSASDRIHSAPALVLPKPRPARISHVDQFPSGGSCEGRATLAQSVSIDLRRRAKILIRQPRTRAPSLRSSAAQRRCPRVI